MPQGSSAVRPTNSLYLFLIAHNKHTLLPYIRVGEDCLNMSILQRILILKQNCIS